MIFGSSSIHEVNCSASEGLLQPLNFTENFPEVTEKFELDPMLQSSTSWLTLKSSTFRRMRSDLYKRDIDLT